MVTFTVKSTLPTTNESGYEQKFSVYGTGDVKVTSTLNPGEDLPMIPVVGNTLTLPKEFSHVTWYGKGPDENYIDRQSGYEVGVYKKDVEDFFVDYIKPQETGNRTDTRWVSITNDDGVGLLAKAETDTPIEFSALYYTAEDLSNALHSYQLEDKDNVILRLNQRQMGVGGDNSWGAKPFEKYQNTADHTYEYTYTFNPVTTDEIEASMDEYKVVLPNEGYEGGDEETEQLSTDVLEYAIELAGKADTEGIIPMIAKEFETRLAAANEILDRVNGGDTEVTQEEVDNAWKALIDIMQYLEFKQGDKTDLEKVIAFAESLDMNDYEDDEKMDAFLEALDEARAVRDDENAMQKEIDNAWMALLKATAELNRKLADMTDLNKVIEWTSALDLDKYLEEGQEEFKAALEAAKEVAGDILSTQREVDSAWKTLMDAASALRLKPDKSALDELLQTAESYMAKEGEYEAAAFAAFRTAYADAAAVFENEQATADEVRTAQKNLGDAITNLDDSIAKTDEKAEFIANAGASTTSDTIKKDVAGTKTTEVKSAKTGDMANPAIFAAAIVMAACAAAMAGVKRKHR